MKSIFTYAWQRLLSTFLAGLFTILPLVITVAIVSWVISFIRRIVGEGTWIGIALQSLGRQGGWAGEDDVLATILGWTIVLTAIFLLGLLVQNKTRNILVSAMNGLFNRLPLVGSLYSTASQFVKLLNKQEKSELSGMSVVMVRLGGDTGAGLLALMPSAELYRFKDVDHHVVYIPTSPVPMTGGLLYVPASQVERLPMSVESLMSIYLSMGITSPQGLADHLSSAEATS